MPHVIGLDFGTTNSAIAVATADGSTQLASFEGAGYRTTTFRSVLYFDPEMRTPTHKLRAIAGPAAIDHYLRADTAGRLMQSMKSYLASRSFRHTYVFGERYRLEELIAIILRQLRRAAEVQFGDLGSPVVVGRPVHFSGPAA